MKYTIVRWKNTYKSRLGGKKGTYGYERFLVSRELTEATGESVTKKEVEEK